MPNRAKSAPPEPICPNCRKGRIARKGRFDAASGFWWCDHCEAPFFSLAPRPGYTYLYAESFAEAVKLLPQLEAAAKAAHEREELVVDYITPPSSNPEASWLKGKVFPVLQSDYLKVQGTAPSVCPTARPKIPAAYLAPLVEGLRKRGLLEADQTIHWVGRQAGLETSCGCDLLSGTPAKVREERLTLDPQTQTVTLDGKQYHIDNPHAFRVYKAIAEKRGEPIKRAQLRADPYRFKGEKTVRKLLDTLPQQLSATIKSGSPGYWLCLPPEKI